MNFSSLSPRRIFGNGELLTVEIPSLVPKVE
jgi:hypothetical protein